MMCGGLTVYSPLVRHGCKKDAKIGLIGVGGLGHFAVRRKRFARFRCSC